MGLGLRVGLGRGVAVLQAPGQGEARALQDNASAGNTCGVGHRGRLRVRGLRARAQRFRMDRIRVGDGERGPLAAADAVGSPTSSHIDLYRQVYMYV